MANNKPTRKPIVKTRKVSNNSSTPTIGNLTNRSRMAIFTLLFANIGLVSLLVTNAAVAGMTTSFETSQFNSVNAYRNQAGVASMTRSACLSGIARAWAKRIGEAQMVVHSSNTKSGIYNESFDYVKQVSSQCGNTWTWMAENVGYSTSDSETIMTAFMNSSGHRKNILKPEGRYVGVGAYRASNGRTYVSHVFAGCTKNCSPSYTTGPISLGEPGSNPKNTLFSGEKLTSGKRITADNGSYYALMETNGNLVVKSQWGRLIWESKTAGNNGSYAIFQSDGNFVIYKPNGKSCHTGTYGKNAKRITVQQDGNFVIYDNQNTAVWASNGKGALHCS